MLEYATARRNMVESQLRTNKVTDPKLLQSIQDMLRALGHRPGK